MDNSLLAELIDERIHNAVYRAVARDKLIEGLTYEKTAERNGYSVSQVKRIVKMARAACGQE